MAWLIAVIVVVAVCMLLLAVCISLAVVRRRKRARLAHEYFHKRLYSRGGEDGGGPAATLDSCLVPRQSSADTSGMIVNSPGQGSSGSGGATGVGHRVWNLLVQTLHMRAEGPEPAELTFDGPNVSAAARSPACSPVCICVLLWSVPNHVDLKVAVQAAAQPSACVVNPVAEASYPSQ